MTTFDDCQPTDRENDLEMQGYLEWMEREAQQRDPWRAALGAPPNAPDWASEVTGVRACLSVMPADLRTPFVIEAEKGATVTITAERVIIDHPFPSE